MSALWLKTRDGKMEGEPDIKLQHMPRRAKRLILGNTKAPATNDVERLRAVTPGGDSR